MIKAQEHAMLDIKDNFNSIPLIIMTVQSVKLDELWTYLQPYKYGTQNFAPKLLNTAKIFFNYFPMNVLKSQHKDIGISYTIVLLKLEAHRQILIYSRTSKNVL